VGHVKNTQNSSTHSHIKYGCTLTIDKLRAETTCPLHANIDVERRRFERDFSATTKSLSAQYRFNEHGMVYLSWSDGFKSGGFNQRYNAAPPGNSPISFEPETAETW